MYTYSVDDACVSVRKVNTRKIRSCSDQTLDLDSSDTQRPRQSKCTTPKTRANAIDETESTTNAPQELALRTSGKHLFGGTHGEDGQHTVEDVTSVRQREEQPQGIPVLVWWLNRRLPVQTGGGTEPSELKNKANDANPLPFLAQIPLHCWP